MTKYEVGKCYLNRKNYSSDVVAECLFSSDQTVILKRRDTGLEILTMPENKCWLPYEPPLEVEYWVIIKKEKEGINVWAEAVPFLDKRSKEEVAQWYEGETLDIFKKRWKEKK